MAKVEKIQLQHPEGKKAPAIRKSVYNIFSAAIVEVLRKQQPCTLSEIAEGVKGYIVQNNISFEGSVEWFSVAVKQHLETNGVISTIVEKGRKLHRLEEE